MVHRDLLAPWKGPGASHRTMLGAAVVALECSARVWESFAPVAGRRRLHLLRRLEYSLASTERQILAAELPLMVTRPMVSRASRAALLAIEDLLGATVDCAESLAALEDAAVDLAALAVRIAVNLDAIAGAQRGLKHQPRTLGRQLGALAVEIDTAAHTRRSAGVEDLEDNHLGPLLRMALSVEFPTRAIARADLSGGDRCLCADALCSLRACWRELAIGLWMIVEALDDLMALGTFGGRERLVDAASSRAGIALISSGLCRRAGDFDHLRAWERHREALGALVSDVCLALQTCEPDAVVRAQQLALRRLARALAAIWAVDERLHATVQTSPPCP